MKYKKSQMIQSGRPQKPEHENFSCNEVKYWSYRDVSCIYLHGFKEMARFSIFITKEKLHSLEEKKNIL